MKNDTKEETSAGFDTRDRKRPLRVYVSAVERAQIQARAASANLSVSDYLRTAGLNHPIRSTMDHDAIRALAALHGDLGRVGGLLKLWLAERRNQGVPAVQVDAELNALAQLRRMLGEKIKSLA